MALTKVTSAVLNDDSVTEDKLANSINAAITANTAKVTNATHTGDVTGDAALTIATGAVETGHFSLTAAINVNVDQNSGTLKLWSGTQSQYDAIGSKDASTIYFIT